MKIEVTRVSADGTSGSPSGSTCSPKSCAGTRPRPATTTVGTEAEECQADGAVDKDRGRHERVSCRRRLEVAQRHTVVERQEHRVSGDLRHASGSAVLARHPQNVLAALVVGMAAGDEEEIGQAVDVFQAARADTAFSPAASASSTMSRSARRQTVRARCR